MNRKNVPMTPNANHTASMPFTPVATAGRNRRDQTRDSREKLMAHLKNNDLSAFPIYDRAGKLMNKNPVTPEYNNFGRNSDGMYELSTNPATATIK